MQGIPQKGSLIKTPTVTEFVSQVLLFGKDLLDFAQRFERTPQTVQSKGTVQMTHCCRIG